MTEMRSAEEALVIGEPGRRLDARLSCPSPACAGAVVCHPHPQYGGTMDDAVVMAVVETLARSGWATLRFNFGREFTNGPAELGDVRVALDVLADRVRDVPLALVGYSFGAWVAVQVAAGASTRVCHVVAVGPPLAFFAWDFLDALAVPISFVVGDRDQFCPASRLAAVREGRSIELRTIAGADHFFGGRWDEVGATVADVLRPLA